MQSWGKGERGKGYAEGGKASTPVERGHAPMEGMRGKGYAEGGRSKGYAEGGPGKGYAPVDGGRGKSYSPIDGRSKGSTSMEGGRGKGFAHAVDSGRGKGYAHAVDSGRGKGYAPHEGGRGKAAPATPSASATPALRGGSTTQLMHVLAELMELRPDALVHLSAHEMRDPHDVQSSLQPAISGNQRTECLVVQGDEHLGSGAAQMMDVPVSLPPPLSTATHLISLALYRLPLSGTKALAPLSPLKRLRVLRLEESPTLCTEALREIQDCTELQLVSFNGCSAFEDQAVGFLMPMQQLHSLHLDYTQCADTTLLLATVFPKLCQLHMAGTAVTDHGLRVLCKRASLTELRMPECHKLTDEGITLLKQQVCPSPDSSSTQPSRCDFIEIHGTC